MIDWKRITWEDRAIFEQYLNDGQARGCERGFTNMCLWGKQWYAQVAGCLVFYAEWMGQSAYPYPVGPGNKRAAIEAIWADAKERGVPFRPAGLNRAECQELESLYPGVFETRAYRGSFDYVYEIDALADLKGKKYHGKRNHAKRFWDAHPDAYAAPMTAADLAAVQRFVGKWYAARFAEDPDGDFEMELEAFGRAMAGFGASPLIGMVLWEPGADAEPDADVGAEPEREILAITLGSPLTPDTFDVHFEKARGDVEGAYAAINQAFARYVREQFPTVCFLDREEDMGLAGLRKSKESYRPHHLQEKWRAYLPADAPDETPDLWALWQEAFGDTDAFLETFWATAYDPARCRYLKVDGRVAAALCWFDCECRGEKWAYVYGVATAKAHRGKGLSHRLLAETQEHLADRGYAGVLLVPGSESLFRFYEGQGYAACSWVREDFCAASEDIDDEPVLQAASVETAIRPGAEAARPGAVAQPGTAVALSGVTSGAGFRQIGPAEYAALRRQYLPEGGVIQEGENLAFLQTHAKFYAGPDFVLAATDDDGALFGVELLTAADAWMAGTCGASATDAAAARARIAEIEQEVLQALYYKEGTFRGPIHFLENKAERRPISAKFDREECTSSSRPFAMYYSLGGASPTYFGFAFD